MDLTLYLSLSTYLLLSFSLMLSNFLYPVLSRPTLFAVSSDDELSIEREKLSAMTAITTKFTSTSPKHHHHHHG